MGDDGEDWHHNMNIKADLLGFTYTDVFEFYEGGTYPGSIDAAGIHHPWIYPMLNRSY